MTPTDTEPVKLYVPRYKEIEVTQEEFLKHVQMDKIKPYLNIGTIVEYKGEYSKFFYAVITGVSKRVEGYYYEGRRASPNGYDHVTFSETAVVRVCYDPIQVGI